MKSQIVASALCLSKDEVPLVWQAAWLRLGSNTWHWALSFLASCQGLLSELKKQRAWKGLTRGVSVEVKEMKR